ncbi:MAG TPA: hypothetical protein VLM37_11200 [Fibrobacteraceae bacterium]|nr:hypothetical protein [Fibrobacteraceae bacterium]
MNAFDRVSVLFRFSPFLLCFFLLSCTGNPEHAGSASVTTNGTVAGFVLDSAGIGVAGVQTSLIRLDYDPDESDSTAVFNQTTDSSGAFSFDSVRVGDYRLVAWVTDSSLAGTRDRISVLGDSVQVASNVWLESTGSLCIFSSTYAFAEGDRFYLPGTNLEHKVTVGDISNGVVVISNIPQGVYRQVMLDPAETALDIPLLGDSLQVGPDTATLEIGYESAVASPIGFFYQDRPTDLALGGADGDTVIVADTAALKAAAQDSLPHVILVSGMIPGDGSIMRVYSNKTILGIGDSSGLDSLGFSLRSDSNIVIRNLYFRRGADDAISIEDTAKFIWIDHNTFDLYGDGQIDIKRASDDITVSWNRFLNNTSVSVIGHSDSNGEQDSTHLRVTFHHNWFEHTHNANPRVRYGLVHAFNEYYDSISDYGVASTMYAKVVLESDIFESVDEPTVIGHTSSADGDLIASNILLLESGDIVTSGTAFSPATYYSYSPDPVEDVRFTLRLCAGAGKLLSLVDR